MTKKKVNKEDGTVYKLQRQIQINRPHIQIIMSTESSEENLDVIIDKVSKLLDKYGSV